MAEFPLPVDLRSDTVTKATPAMREAMAKAEVGDDVYAEDPTVTRLEERVALLLGKEAALFVPTGTMANQIGVGVHCDPGDEVLCEETSHVYVWECGGMARLSGVTARTVRGSGGIVPLADLIGKVRPDDGHYVRTRLVCLENTHNRGGGRVYPADAVAAIARWAGEHGLAMHLDGARLFNASVASGESLSSLAAPFATVSVCFSKGLGAPVGSALAGGRDLIKKAHRLRKLFGGGMRQAGHIAAAALYALDHHIPRLAEDHHHARILAEAVTANPHLALESGAPQTNLLWITVDPAFGSAADVARTCRERGVLISALGDQVLRACTHLDVDRDRVEYAARVIRELQSLTK